MSRLGEVLRQQRALRHWSLMDACRELARRGVPLSDAYLSQIENGTRAGTPHAVRAATLLYGLNEDWLLYLAGLLPERVVALDLDTGGVARMYGAAEQIAQAAAHRAQRTRAWTPPDQWGRGGGGS
jgi:transcriptional regulator with XRE-family HTH domain